MRSGFAWTLLVSLAACRGEPPRPDVPPLTKADPSATPLGDVTSTSISDGGRRADAKETPVRAAFTELPGTVAVGGCERALVAVAKGKLVALGETLGPGDVLVLNHGRTFDAGGSGVVLVVHAPYTGCENTESPALIKNVVRATAAPELKFAGGKMAAHLDVGAALSPDVYLGRLEGTAAVAEHVHPGTWEILAAAEGAGTFTIDGKDQRLSARQIVIVPPDTKHAWKPDANAKLVAFQMYSPPGPEQRFVALATGDAGAASVTDGGKPDAAKADAGK